MRTVNGAIVNKLGKILDEFDCLTATFVNVLVRSLADLFVGRKSADSAE